MRVCFRQVIRKERRSEGRAVYAILLSCLLFTNFNTKITLIPIKQLTNEQK